MPDKRNTNKDAHVTLGSNYVQIHCTHPFYDTIVKNWRNWKDLHSNEVEGIKAISFTEKKRSKDGLSYISIGSGIKNYSNRVFWRVFFSEICDRARLIELKKSLPTASLTPEMRKLKSIVDGLIKPDSPAVINELMEYAMNGVIQPSDDLVIIMTKILIR